MKAFRNRTARPSSSVVLKRVAVAGALAFLVVTLLEQGAPNVDSAASQLRLLGDDHADTYTLTWYGSTTARAHLSQDSWSWSDAKNFCAAQKKRLCKRDEYCPHGPGKEPIGRAKSENSWAPAGDGPHTWVQVGVWGGDASKTCQAHAEVFASTPNKFLETEMGYNYFQWIACCSDAEDAAADAKPSNPFLIPTKRTGGIYDADARHKNILRKIKVTNPKIVLVGDSITHNFGGEQRCDDPNGWHPFFCAGHGVWRDLFLDDDALNLGFGYDRIENVLWRIDNGEMDGIDPHTVILNIGTNNVYPFHHPRDTNPDQVVEGIVAVIQRIKKKCPNARILVMSIFPWGDDPDHPYRAKREEVNSRLPAALADLTDVENVNINSMFINEETQALHPGVMVWDGLHPAPEGYKIWGDALRPYLDK